MLQLQCGSQCDCWRQPLLMYLLEAAGQVLMLVHLPIAAAAPLEQAGCALHC